MRHRRPTRLPSFSYCGKYRYYVTFGTFHRKVTFTRTDVIESVRAQILRTLEERHFALLAEVYMPDHVHLLIGGLCDAANFRSTMTLIRQRTTIEYRRQFVREALWQDGYFERVLRPWDSGRATADYIVANPVEAGLAATPAAYPYLSSTFHTELEGFGERRALETST